MSRSRPRRGFSIIEAIVAVALLGIGVASALGALGHLIQAETSSMERTRMVELAVEKMHELRATGDYTLAPLDGDFQDYGESLYSWTAELQPTGVENLDQFTVTVTRQESSGASETLNTLIFHAPVASGGTTP